MRISESIKTFLLGVLWIGIAFLFWLSLIGNPFNEFMLITRHTQTTTGNLVDTIDHDRYDEGVYTFYIPNKGEFKTSIELPLGELKKQQEVEYLPDNPSVCRIKGDGCQSIIAFLLRKVVGGIFAIILFISPGVIMLKNGIRDIKKIRAEASLPKKTSGL